MWTRKENDLDETPIARFKRTIINMFEQLKEEPDIFQ